MTKLFPYLILLTVVIFSSCAQQTPLSGGERDKTPPQIDSNKTVIPANGTTNFSASRVIIPFNEYVKLKDKEKQILITPFPETPPDIYVKGKKIIVDFSAPLENNTTYIINFGKSIVDITEGNEMVNYKYVFSTGSYIDSLSYQGVVYDGFNKTPVEGAYIMLYKEHEDSIIVKEKPNYFGVTNSFGKCTIDNIAEGSYKVVTFMEDNGNYIWEPANEMIGFTEQLFDAAKDTIVDTMVIFKNYPTELKIEDITISSSAKGTIVFNQSLEEAFQPENDSLVKTFAMAKSAQLNASRDSLFFYLSKTLEPGEKYPFGIQSLSPRKTLVPLNSDTSLLFKTNATRGLKPEEDLFFTFSQPITEKDFSKIELKLEDKLIPFELVQTGINQITIEADWQPDESYEIVLYPSAVTSYRSVANDTITAYFETLNENDFGKLVTSIKVSNGDYILGLLQDGKVKYRDYPTKGEFSTAYSHLTPGNYRLRVIFDENNNAIWDTGDYFNHTQPERVEYYSDPIQIKKGWDMEINWEITD